MKFISALAALILCFLIVMNHGDITISLLSAKFAALANLAPYSVKLNMAVYTLVVFVLGETAAVFFFAPLYKSLKEKFNAYKRELEKGSISNTSSEAKIQVLENKITVLEKALDDALKNRG